ncbi:MAG: hypothetical protein KC729_13840 [Candidatus Eisenbacteria bacterium]|uniref:RNA polymerase sigma-70 ECF-like HTH domain-containing protein n=1 Tax=Eiseniibacteriota bacterium TaxID=2212470 RepID=A0A956M237_UNCEI|nr:hypothetical protein [Candidatus Eisenbacteria bacterium]
MDDRISSDPTFWAEIAALRLPNEPTIKVIVDHLYEDLRRMAHRIMASDGGRTLQPTALLHDAYRRLQAAAEPIRFQNSEHVMRLFARTMRRILIDEAKKRRTMRRSGTSVPPTWIVFRDDSQLELELIVDIDLALKELGRKGERGKRQADVLELVLFSNATQQDVARELGISLRQVERDWSDGRFWLAKQLH